MNTGNNYCWHHGLVDKSKKKELECRIFKVSIQEKNESFYVGTLVPGVRFCTLSTPGKKMAAPALARKNKKYGFVK